MSASEITQKTDFLSVLARSGLTLPQALVLASLVEAADITGLLNEGELTVKMSRYDIHQRTGLSMSQVQRAVSSLAEAGFIAREQMVKRDGEVASTMLRPAALSLMAIEDGKELSDTLPLHIAALLIGESADVVKAVCRAWEDAAPWPATVDSAYRGSSSKLAALQSHISQRLERVLGAKVEAAQAAHHQQEAEDRGEYPLTLPCGQTVTLSRPRFVEAARDRLAALVDMRFVRDTLQHIGMRHPQMLTLKTLPRLVADIGFSRAAGFVFNRDAADAVRILASCITRPGWGTPRKMDGAWYDHAAFAVC